MNVPRFADEIAQIQTKTAKNFKKCQEISRNSKEFQVRIGDVQKCGQLRPRTASDCLVLHGISRNFNKFHGISGPFLLSSIARRCRRLDPRCLYSIEPDRADLSEYNNRTPRFLPQQKSECCPIPTKQMERKIISSSAGRTQQEHVTGKATSWGAPQAPPRSR